MNSQSKKLGFFHSFEEMQKTFERLNISITGHDRMRSGHGNKLPKINKSRIPISKNSDFSENMDNKEALIYNIPEIALRRNWNSDRSNLLQNEPKVLKHLEYAYPTYKQDIKRSAQIARVSGKYPNTKDLSPRFKIVLPSIKR